jgi:hypothetical protein|tara:strand:- start:79 stop:252 length:174 start_codon:yes stop_codon:yes gene_type:complete
MTADWIMLKGQSDSIASVTSYKNALLENGGFTSVEITSFEKVIGDTSRVVFAIEVEL